MIRLSIRHPKVLVVAGGVPGDVRAELLLLAEVAVLVALQLLPLVTY